MSLSRSESSAKVLKRVAKHTRNPSHAETTPKLRVFLTEIEVQFTIMFGAERFGLLSIVGGGKAHMKKCDQCSGLFDEKDGRPLHSLWLCDECYLDRVWPKVRKAFYENEPSEFMRRLKESYSIVPQQYH